MYLYKYVIVNKLNLITLYTSLNYENYNKEKLTCFKSS